MEYTNLDDSNLMTYSEGTYKVSGTLLGTTTLRLKTTPERVTLYEVNLNFNHEISPCVLRYLQFFFFLNFIK